MEAAEVEAVEVVDLAATPLRELNQRLHDLAGGDPGRAHWRVLNPNGAHAVACGLDADVEVEVDGHVGLLLRGDEQARDRARARQRGHRPRREHDVRAGRVEGNASQSAGATGHGGLLVVHGDAAARCGISMKGIDIVVRGSVGHLSGVHGADRAGSSSAATPARRSATRSTRRASTCAASVAGLGADCVEKELRDEHRAELRELLARAGIDDADPADFRRYGSARQLYTFKVDNAGAY